MSAVPDSLPCRESEFEAVYSFIEGKINSGTGGYNFYHDTLMCIVRFKLDNKKLL